jgi:hypothetical protein
MVCLFLLVVTVVLISQLMRLNINHRETLFTCLFGVNVKIKNALHNFVQRVLLVWLLIVVSLNLVSCGQAKQDREIKADIATKVKTDVNFAGVNYTVNKGVVTLTGFCATEKSRQIAEKTIKGINIIKGINNLIKIAPVVITADQPLKQSVDSILAAYPTIQADVLEQVVTLKGDSKKQEAEKLIPALNKLNPIKIQNQMTVQ